MGGLLQRLGLRRSGAEADAPSAVADAAAADSPAVSPPPEPPDAALARAEDRADAVSPALAVEEAAFLAALARTTGRDLAAWMAWIAGKKATATRNGIIDLLQCQGFDFRWASVLERTFAGLPTCSAGHGAVAEQTQTRTRPQAGGLITRDATGAVYDARQRHDSSLLHRHAAEHAEALLHWLWAAGHEGRMWARDVQSAYAEMCSAHRWRQHHWNQTGDHFRQLVIRRGGDSRYADYRDEAGAKRRWCFYQLPAPDSGADSPPQPARAAA